MNRRNFAKRAVSGIAVAAGGAHVAAAAGVADAVATVPPTGDWLRQPARLVGQTFVLEDGTLLTLAQAIPVLADPRLSQWRLKFATARDLPHGIHRLRLADGSAQVMDLFLQCNGKVATACTSRLA